MAVKRCADCNIKVQLEAPTCPECGCNSFRYKCPQCGAVYQGKFCTSCGCPAPATQAAYQQAPTQQAPVTQPVMQPSMQNQQIAAQQSAYIQPSPQFQQQYQPPRSRLACPRCGSNNISVQAVTLTKTKGHGILYWLCFVWLFDLLLWLFLFLPRLIIALFGHKKVTSKTHSEAVCQDCGNRWKLK